MVGAVFLRLQVHPLVGLFLQVADQFMRIKVYGVFVVKVAAVHFFAGFFFVFCVNQHFTAINVFHRKRPNRHVSFLEFWAYARLQVQRLFPLCLCKFKT